MPKKSKKYWSTLEEFNRSADVERLKKEEFFDKPEDTISNDNGPRGFNRRDFMKLGGAAAVFSMIACGSRPVEKIVPYVNQPEEIVPGLPNYYASTCSECPAACGLIVKTREGRPIKLEGNPDHPVNKGKLCARGQASLLNLYDPDRARYPGKILSDGTMEQHGFEELDKEIIEKLNNANGQVVFLTGSWQGPSQTRLLTNFINTKKWIQYKYEALHDDRFVLSRIKSVGDRRFPQYHFDKADVVVLLGSDLFTTGQSRVKTMAGFASKRRVTDGQMSKVYAFGPTISEMGAMADERFPIKSSDLIKIAGALVHQFVIKEKKSELYGNSRIINAYTGFDPDKIEKELELPHGLIHDLAALLWENRGKSIVASECFSSQTGNAEYLHTTVNLLNIILDNEKRTVETLTAPMSQMLSSYEKLEIMLNDMNAGKVSAILISGTNPIYSLPDSFGFAEALKKVPIKISLSDRLDETALHCDYLLPSLHGAECWNDFESELGVYGIQQPTISPLWENRQVEDTLIIIGAALGFPGFTKDDVPMTFYEFMKDYWRQELPRLKNIAGSFEDFWISFLQNGFFQTENTASYYRPSFKDNTVIGLEYNNDIETGLELVLTASSIHFDGRSMNNAWLLETPDPISTITWNNYLSIAPARAKQMELKEGDVVKLTANNVSVEIPIHIAPGTHKDVVALSVGWGRTAVGQVGNNIGVNAFKLAGYSDFGVNYTIKNVKIEKTDKIVPLAAVQGHNYIEHRPILHETTLDEFKNDPRAGQHHPPHEKQTLWKQEHSYPGHKWGMAIDLNSCIGCNACMTACQVENNVPVVGKEQVLFGREMHWIRIDRYFEGEPDNPDIIRQPMLCHHCDKAPCETVCPVLATVHNDEGLNLQVYNRCVGTRYCSNNCPYKVRRFNYYDYYKNAYEEKPLQMLLNPDVTVRSRGVMEKCTFCIQRIRDAKHNAKKKGQPIAAGDIQTACQQTCPTSAIVFGDLNDPKSEISKLTKQKQAFKTLEELNIDPNVSYMTLVRNRKKESGDDEPGH
jgi:MoCo/4Fe-4S cofactor protein with predicted Tat translocation signal